jgi:hypothetical protein
VQLWHKQHLKDQTKARTSSTRRKSNAVGVPVVGNGNKRRYFGSGVVL